MREFIIELDRPRRLVYDLDAWDRIADRFKPKDQEGYDTADFLKANLSARDLPFLVYAGCAWQDQKLTEAKAKELLNAAIREGRLTIMGAFNTVIEAIFAQAGFKFKEPGAADKTRSEPENKSKKAPAPRIPGSKKSAK